MTAPIASPRRVRQRLHALARDSRGATILEFGLIAPTLCVMLLGALDIGHTLYMQSVLQGAVQKAARDSTLETASGSTATVRDTIDNALRNQLLTLHNNAAITINRRFYRSFTLAAAKTAETFTDTNANGVCDNGEPFDDRNGNGVRDTDGGDSVGRAGARDDVVYTVTVSYPRMFPINKLIGGSPTTTLTASTVLSNQPYGDQGSYGAPAVGNCP